MWTEGHRGSIGEVPWAWPLRLSPASSAGDRASDAKLFRDTDMGVACRRARRPYPASHGKTAPAVRPRHLRPARADDRLCMDWRRRGVATLRPSRTNSVSSRRRGVTSASLRTGRDREQQTFNEHPRHAAAQLTDPAFTLLTGFSNGGVFASYSIVWYNERLAGVGVFASGLAEDITPDLRAAPVKLPVVVRVGDADTGYQPLADLLVTQLMGAGWPPARVDSRRFVGGHTWSPDMIRGVRFCEGSSSRRSSAHKTKVIPMRLTLCSPLERSALAFDLGLEGRRCDRGASPSPWARGIHLDTERARGVVAESSQASARFG
jgi:dienelactone hydrolase